MNLEETVEKVRSECQWTGEDYTKVYVAGASDSVVADSLVDLFEDWAKRDGKGRVIRTGSFGYYDLEPIVVTERPGEPQILYCRVNEEIASQLIDCLDQGGRRPDLALFSMGDEHLDGIPRAANVPLISLQTRIALRNCGLVNPQDPRHYLAVSQGYRGLAKALRLDRASVLTEIRDAGLRDGSVEGRLAAERWQLFLDTSAARAGTAPERVVVCNAVDGDGRGWTARLLLDSDPHTVLEGLLIAAYALGASGCILCASQEHRGRLIKLIERMRELGVLETHLLDSSFECHIEIRTVQPSLVLLDDSALLCALAGRQTIPDSRYAYPAGRYEGKDAFVCDAETLASLPAILEKGGSWFSGIGIPSCPGTRVMTLSGDVSHPYTVEVPFGTTIENVINDIGGGVKSAIKAVRLGPPTAPFLGDDEITSAIDCGKGLRSGSGVVEAISVDNCGVEVTEKIISFLQGESCGKCVFCREGILQISETLKAITQGDGGPEDVGFITDLAKAMMEGCLCDLGRNAARLVLSSISLFQSDYEVHIGKKRCPKNLSN